MAVIIVFMAVIGGIVAWWLSHQRLTSKPWLEEGVIGEIPGTGASTLPAAKIGLGVFLAVVGALFAIFTSAYFMRMPMAEWRPVPVPGLLWFNTGVLVASSIALQWAVIAVRRGRMGDVRWGLLAGGFTASAFVAGQLAAWQRLADAGYFVAANPADSFFYLITGMHGLHVVGGLVALGRTAAKAWDDVATDRVRESVTLCATYWHFLLVIWLALFGLLTGWGDEFAAICRQWLI